MEILSYYTIRYRNIRLLSHKFGNILRDIWYFRDIHDLWDIVFPLRVQTLYSMVEIKGTNHSRGVQTPKLRDSTTKCSRVSHGHRVCHQKFSCPLRKLVHSTNGTEFKLLWLCLLWLCKRFKCWIYHDIPPWAMWLRNSCFQLPSCKLRCGRPTFTAKTRSVELHKSNAEMLPSKGLVLRS